jgi:hypothetical protein
MLDVAVLADAQDMQLDSQVDAISKENAIREEGLSTLPSLPYK